MNIPSLRGIGIPFFYPIEEKGFLEAGLRPLYNPGILVCHREKSDPQDLPIALKGLYILIDTAKKLLFIGEGGIDGRKAILCGNIPSRFRRVWYGDGTITDNIPDWDRAILFFDWEDDISADENIKAILAQITEEMSSKVKNEEEDERKVAERLNSKINELMIDEIEEFRKLLFSKLNELGGFRLTNMPEQEFSGTDLNSQRYECYVVAIIEILQIITEWSR